MRERKSQGTFFDKAEWARHEQRVEETAKKRPEGLADAVSMAKQPKIVKQTPGKVTISSTTASLTQPALIQKIVERGEAKLARRLRSDGAANLMTALLDACASGGLKATGLKTLDVGDNGLDPASTNAVAACAADARARIKNFRVAGNRMDGAGCLALARGLARENCSLRSVDASRCGLDDDAVRRPERRLLRASRGRRTQSNVARMRRDGTRSTRPKTERRPQVLAFLEQLAVRNRSLKELVLRENELKGGLGRAVRAARNKARRSSTFGRDDPVKKAVAPAPVVSSTAGLSPLLHAASWKPVDPRTGNVQAINLSTSGALSRIYQILEAKAKADAKATRGHASPDEPLADFVATWHARRFGGGGAGSAGRKTRELLHLLQEELSSHEPDSPDRSSRGDSVDTEAPLDDATQRRVRLLLDVIGISPQRRGAYAPCFGAQFVLLLARLFTPNGVARALDLGSSVTTKQCLDAIAGRGADKAVPATWDAPFLLPLASDQQLLELVERVESLGRRRRHHVPLDDFADVVLSFMYRTPASETRQGQVAARSGGRDDADRPWTGSRRTWIFRVDRRRARRYARAAEVQAELRAAFRRLGAGDGGELGWETFVELVDVFREGHTHVTQAREVELFEEVTDRRPAEFGAASPFSKHSPRRSSNFSNLERTSEADEAVEEATKLEDVGPIKVALHVLVMGFWKAGVYRRRKHASGFELASKAAGIATGPQTNKWDAVSDDENSDSDGDGLSPSKPCCRKPAPVALPSTPWRVSLISLDLSKNHIEDKFEVAAVLAAAPSLETLLLDRNPIGDGGAIAIAATCDRAANANGPRRLTRLGLAGCGVRARGALALADLRWRAGAGESTMAASALAVF